MLKIGSVIDGKYKILNVIGRGGMSIVYLAMNERANKSWAIKEVRKHKFGDFAADKKEIEMMKRLKHPHLPSVADVIERADSLLIVMDYVEGRSLEELLKEQGAQPQEQVLLWARQLCDVLGYLHAQSPPIIYRDMKPANVMLKPDGTITLIDLGAAREFKPQKWKDTICLGTYGYAAPEQYVESYEKVGQSDQRTDIYCLGVMLFQLVTGENPHKLRPIREVDPGLSAGLEVIIQTCTRIKKEERYQSCQELLCALEHYWELDASYQKRQKKKLWMFLLPAAAAGIFAISGGIFGGLERQARNNSYEACLLAARNSTQKEEELANYEKAIGLNPFREEGYRELLQYGFLDDNQLTGEESQRLRSVLIRYSNTYATNEAIFQENEAGYARFAYEAGIAYFYKFEETENKKNARGYFEIAARSEDLTKKQVERARRLYVIADYYSRIDLVDEAGDAWVTYRDYWEDLVELTWGNLVETDNERTALVMYQEVVNQILSRSAGFQKAGVTRQEILDQLAQMKQHLEEDFTKEDDSNGQIIGEEIEQLKKWIQKAERLVRSAYEQ